jgi:putative membrane protein
MTILPYLYPLHIAFMVAWFAGVFFLGRLLIYYKDACDNNHNQIIELTTLGMRRAWIIIILPAMSITIFVGLLLAVSINAFVMSWFHFKMLFVLLFVYYCFYLNYLRLKSLKKQVLPSSNYLRLLNEVPFILLIIILMVVYLNG